MNNGLLETLAVLMDSCNDCELDWVIGIEDETVKVTIYPDIMDYSSISMVVSATTVKALRHQVKFLYKNVGDIIANKCFNDHTPIDNRLAFKIVNDYEKDAIKVIDNFINGKRCLNDILIEYDCIKFNVNDIIERINLNDEVFSNISDNDINTLDKKCLNTIKMLDFYFMDLNDKVKEF